MNAQEINSKFHANIKSLFELLFHGGIGSSEQITIHPFTDSERFTEAVRLVGSLSHCKEKFIFNNTVQKNKFATNVTNKFSSEMKDLLKALCNGELLELVDIPSEYDFQVVNAETFVNLREEGNNQYVDFCVELHIVIKKVQ